MGMGPGSVPHLQHVRDGEEEGVAVEGDGGPGVGRVRAEEVRPHVAGQVHLQSGQRRTSAPLGRGSKTAVARGKQGMIDSKAWAFLIE